MPLSYECHYCDRHENTDRDEDRFCTVCEVQICTDCGIYNDDHGEWYCEDCEQDRTGEPPRLPIDDLLIDDDPWDDPSGTGGA